MSGATANDATTPAPGGTEHERSLKNIAAVVYALQATSFLLPILYFVAIIVDYVKRDDARGTLFESHFRWQIRTFWFSLLWFMLGGLTFIFFVGYVILSANALWILYRVIKGWLYLNERRPLPL